MTRKKTSKRKSVNFAESPLQSPQNSPQKVEDPSETETEPRSASITKEFLESHLNALRVEITNQITQQKDEIINHLKEENETLKDELAGLKRELYDKTEEIYAIEKDVVDLQQYVRRNNIEFCGIPNNVEDNALEDKVIEIAETIGVKLQKSEIEACHRLKERGEATGPRRTIVRFTNRKNCERLHRNKKKLKDDAGVKQKLAEKGISNTIYINNNLCPYNKMLWGKCKRLYDSYNIARFWVFNGSLYIAKTENDTGIKVDHLRKLYTQFPRFDFNDRS